MASFFIPASEVKIHVWVEMDGINLNISTTTQKELYKQQWRLMRQKMLICGLIFSEQTNWRSFRENEPSDVWLLSSQTLGGGISLISLIYLGQIAFLPCVVYQFVRSRFIYFF